jgi:hypothetical protein
MSPKSGPGFGRTTCIQNKDLKRRLIPDATRFRRCLARRMVLPVIENHTHRPFANPGRGPALVLRFLLGVEASGKVGTVELVNQRFSGHLNRLERSSSARSVGATSASRPSDRVILDLLSPAPTVEDSQHHRTQHQSFSPPITDKMLLWHKAARSPN